MQRAHPSVMFTWAALAFACVFSLFSSVARAEVTVALRVDYTAPSGCPGAADYLAEVRARTPRARDAAPDEPATTLTVVVRRVAGGHQGTLSLTTEDGASSARKVKAAECAQVVSALALMTALAIDPDASTEPVHVEPKPAQKPEPKPTPTSVPPRAPVPRKSAAERHLRPGLGMGLEIQGGIAPDPMLLLRPMAELGWTGSGPVFRLSVGVGREAAKRDGGGGEFSLVAGRIEGCPFRVKMAESLGLLPCLALDAGRLRVRGLDVSPEARVNRPWASAAAIARLEWTLVKVLVAEMDGLLLTPFVRDRFYVRNADTVHRAPAISGGAVIGLGVRFP